MWRRALAGHVSALALLGWAYPAAVLAHTGAWAHWGVEGSLWGYAGTVVATAVSLWFRAFGWPQRR
jgi:K+-transporting ATPase c subunit